MRNRLDIRVSINEYELIQEAAQKANLSITDFVLNAAAKEGNYTRPSDPKIISGIPRSLNWMGDFMVQGQVESQLAANIAESMNWQDFDGQILRTMDLPIDTKKEIFSTISELRKQH